VIRLPAIKANASGAANRTTSLTAGQVSALYAATAGGRRLYIGIGTGSTAKCGLFSARTVAPYLDALITVGRVPGGLAMDASGLWVTSGMDDPLSRIDPATNTLQAVPLSLDGDRWLGPIAAGAGSLWVDSGGSDAAGNPLPDSVVRIDPRTGTVVATIPLGRGGATWRSAPMPSG
jgi:streptogramin lyase